MPVSYINVPRPAGARSPALHRMCRRARACVRFNTHPEDVCARAAALSARSSRGTLMLASMEEPPYPIPWSQAALTFTWVFVRYRNESPSTCDLLNLRNAPRDSISTNPASRPSISSARSWGISRGTNIGFVNDHTCLLWYHFVMFESNFEP